MIFLEVEKARYRDRAYGQLLSLGSAAVQHAPLLDAAIGASNDPNQTPVRWKHVRPRPHVQPYVPWVSFAAQRERDSPLPKNFEAVAQLSAASSIDRFIDDPQFFEAVAYQLGTTMMVGFKPDGNPLFEAAGDDDSRRSIGMRVGPGVLRAAIGLYQPDFKVFVPHHDAWTEGSVVPMSENNLSFV